MATVILSKNRSGAARVSETKRERIGNMTENEIRALVAEVLVLRNRAYCEEENQLIASGAVLNSQVGGADIRERCAQMRAMAPAPLLLQADLETGSGYAADGLDVPPQMALGAAGDEDLAFAYGRAVGHEGRRLGLDVAWGPVLDVNNNPDNPIINWRSFGEDPSEVGRLGAAMVRGFAAGGLHCTAKHWPGHGDVAVDSHISLPKVTCDRRRLETVEWLPYRQAVAAGLESVMTGHLLVPAIDPEWCATVSPRLIHILRHDLGVNGVVITDSLGMEGLRTTLDSTEAAWRALAAGHDQVLVDYKRPPSETVNAVVAACLDGRIPESRLREAAERVRRLKARRAALPILPEPATIRTELEDMGRRLASASVTAWNGAGECPNLGPRPLLVVCDDLTRLGMNAADEAARPRLEGEHPVVVELRRRQRFSAIVVDETPRPEELARVRQGAAVATGVLGVTFASIYCYKGGGIRLPLPQIALWRELAGAGKLRGMILLESPYALTDLPEGVPVVVTYGRDRFSIAAAAAACFGELPCPGRLPVTVKRGG